MRQCIQFASFGVEPDAEKQRGGLTRSSRAGRRQSAGRALTTRSPAAGPPWRASCRGCSRQTIPRRRRTPRRTRMCWSDTKVNDKADAGQAGGQVTFTVLLPFGTRSCVRLGKVKGMFQRFSWCHAVCLGGLNDLWARSQPSFIIWILSLLMFSVNKAGPLSVLHRVGANLLPCFRDTRGCRFVKPPPCPPVSGNSHVSPFVCLSCKYQRCCYKPEQRSPLMGLQSR